MKPTNSKYYDNPSEIRTNITSFDQDYKQIFLGQIFHFYFRKKKNNNIKVIIE